jgi:uncharacterized protein (DUF1697 family)
VTAYVALLRAVNVGGTGKLPMAELRAMVGEIGFTRVRTFIASGNVLFDSPQPEADVKAKIEARLAAYAGKRVAVFVRTAAELAAIVADDPFRDALGSQHVVFFCDVAPPPDLASSSRNQQGERIAVGRREVYVDYGGNISDSRLKLALGDDHTGRNFNSVRKLAELAAA